MILAVLMSKIIMICQKKLFMHVMNSYIRTIDFVKTRFVG